MAASSIVLSVCIDPLYVIDVNGRDYRFEWSNYCGPTVVTKQGRVVKRWPYGERHPFWKALTQWIRTGKQIDSAGRCMIGNVVVPDPLLSDKAIVLKISEEES